jgi:hypothetical protein
VLWVPDSVGGRPWKSPPARCRRTSHASHGGSRDEMCSLFLFPLVQRMVQIDRDPPYDHRGLTSVRQDSWPSGSALSDCLCRVRDAELHIRHTRRSRIWLKLLHSSPFRPGEEAGATASRGRGGPAWGHTACHPRLTEGQSRAWPSLGRAEGAAQGSRGAQPQTGTAGRDLQRLVRCPAYPPSVCSVAEGGGVM